MRRIVRPAKGGASGQSGKGRSRWSRWPGSARVPGGERRGDTGHLERTSDQSDGLRTDGSRGYQQGCVNLFGQRHVNDGWDQFDDYAFRIGLVTHKADHRRSQFANFTFDHHIRQML